MAILQEGDALFALPQAADVALSLALDGAIPGLALDAGDREPGLFRRVIRAALRPLPADASLWVQAHPKNETHHGLIERLVAPLRSGRPWQLLPADDPLEVRLSSGSSGEGSGHWRVLGFGTNLLAAAVFLAPHHRGVGLCQPAEKGGCWRWSDQWLNRREWRRSQHVRALLTNLLDALDQLQAYC